MNNPFPLPIIASHLPTFRVSEDVTGLQIVMANVYFIRQTDGDTPRWFLVDAGLGSCADRIQRAAESLFGAGSKPSAILLTHGHFDHVGGLAELARRWKVPIYAHALEMPYLTGQSGYAPPDPSVGGGALAAVSGLYPKKPITLTGELIPFPDDGSIPKLDGWRVIPTPGHTAGHVSFFQESTKTLLVGDAFVTVRQSSLSAVLKQKPELHGPPAYFTSDWLRAEQSVAALAALRPEVAASGHGQPMRGETLRQQLDALSEHFGERAVPTQGRYVPQPARADERGVTYVPPAPSSAVSWKTVGLASVAALALAWGVKRWRQ